MGRRLCLALVLALACGVVSAEEPTVDAIRARILEHEAKLFDMNAKLAQSGGGAEDTAGLVSIRKNAVITVGGLVTTGYYHLNYKAEGLRALDADGDFHREGTWRTRARERDGSLEISDAEVYLDIQVNDHFDAFLYLDLQNQSDNYSMAKAYWIRWKDICNSGFGLKVGRDRMAFGDDTYGYLDSWVNGGGDGISWLAGDYFTNYWDGDLVGTAIMPNNGRKFNGVTQITPYWEGFDGKVKAEVSFMQNVDNISNRMNLGVDGSTFWVDKQSGYRHYRSRNYGLGTMSARLTVEPVEGLTIRASAVNFHTKGFANDWTGDADASEQLSKNNTATSLAFSYRPCFLSKLNLWAQWVHGWNVSNLKDLDSDVVNYGASWDVTDSLTLFAQGDYLRSKLDEGDGDYRKGTGWAAYAGAIYNHSSGLIVEAGWRHEQLKDRDERRKLTKFKGDTIYANIGFEF